MKRICSSVFVTLSICLCSSVFSQEVNFTLLSSDEKGVLIQVDFPGFSVIPVDVNGVEMHKLKMGNAYPLEKEGSPELLQSVKAVLIPENAKPVVTVVSSEFTTIPDFLLAPSKGRLLRNVNPRNIPYTLGEVYKQDKYLIEHHAVLGNQYQIRDFHGVSLICYPFSYHPVKKELRRYTSMTICIEYQTASAFPKAGKMNEEFGEIYQRHFINFPADKYLPSTDRGEMLIITPDNFMADLQPFADWKIRNGIPTTIVPLSVAGNTADAVKAYIRNIYEEKNLAYVVLVGDYDQFPTFTIGGAVSDNYYAMLAGDDDYPDVLLGKISAENSTHVSTQINKFIQYEKDPVETAHFPVFCGIASQEGPGDNQEYDYEHIRLIDNMLSGYTYTSGYELFDGSQGGLDAPGSPTPSTLSIALNSGVGIINYAGHGSDDAFSTTGFSTYNINLLTNYHKLPVIFSVACLNGNYAYQTCFAEAWLRAVHNGQPTGAVGAMMSTVLQPWNPPMCAQDEINKILTETIAENNKKSLGGLFFDGLMKMLDVYNDVTLMNSWILFGDPSMMLRTAVPAQLPVFHNEVVMLNAESIGVTSPIEKARICLSANNEVIAEGVIEQGSVMLAVPQLAPEDTIRVLASKFNYLPYESYITFMVSEEPYLIYRSHTVNDPQGNQNGKPDYGETVTLNVCLKNIGRTDSGPATITLSTQDALVTLIDSVMQFAGIDSGISVYTNNAFNIKVADYVSFGHIAEFQLKIAHTDTVYYRNFKQLLYAPLLMAGNLIVNDADSDIEENARLDLNERAELQILIKNTGNSATAPGTGVLTKLNDYLQIPEQECHFPAMQPGEEYTLSFLVQVSPEVSHRALAAVRLTATAGNYLTAKLYRVDIASDVEDWESNGFTKYDWQNNSQTPWTITASNPYEKTYSARSGAISHDQLSELSITLPVAREDSISFYYHVSCEAGNGMIYDRLEFYIDNSLQAYWDGETGWQRAVFPVSAGEHTFIWRYEKDYMVSAGEDRAMLDLITLPSTHIEPVIEDGIQENRPLDFHIYPNPAQDYLSITVRETDRYVIEILDFTGKTVTQIPQYGIAENRISLSSLADGMYLIKITAGDKTGIKKFVKTR